jgi:uncharacterized protein YprB with RNaseH-like and TPR domain
MLSDEIRIQLGQLHRPTWFHETAGTPGGPTAGAARSVPIEPAVAGAFDLMRHGEENANPAGKHLRFTRPLSAFWPASDSVIRRSAFAAAAKSELHGELAAVLEHFPRGTLFLDLETCGFAGSMVFLVGMVWRVGQALVVDQLLARDYAEEKAILHTLWQIASRNRVLITFNGKSFDWPMVRDRGTRHQLGQVQRPRAADGPSEPSESRGRNDPWPELTHCDLLHHARRRWKALLPNCRLQTLERFICRRSRRDDLPGAQVPAAYHQFVRTGAARQVGAILHHNALDLLTLVQVTLALLPRDDADAWRAAQ